LGDIPTLLANGSLVDSGRYFSDIVTSNTNYWSANQTAAYVTNQLLNVPSLPQVSAASVGNLGLNGLGAIDGYTPVAGNYILVKNNTTSGQNGIYKAAAGAWTRQVYNTSTLVYDDIGAQTLYSELNINGGVTNVVNGTVNKNLQFQFYIPIPTATIATNGSSVFVTAVTKLPQASLFNRFVDSNIGNDTLNNGSSSFPFATLTKAQVGLGFPGTITVASGGIDASALTWVAVQQNCVIQGFDLAHDGGQTVLSGVTTFATGSTRNDYVNTTHSNATPFVFQSGALYRNYLQALTISATVGADWLGLHSTATNWITLDNIDFANPLATAINLPAFSGAFTINVENQNRSIMRFSGTGAANTSITINNCVDGYVWVPSTYLGNILWEGSPFAGYLGSAAVPTGVLSTQGDMDTVTGWVADTTYDGWYAIDNFAPTTFAQGAIFGKLTVGGTTFLWWGRNQAQAPATISTTTQTTYQKTSTGWSLIGGTSALAQDLAGGTAGQVVWQQGVDDTAFTAVGTTGQYLKSNGTAAPSWATVPQSNYLSISSTGVIGTFISNASLTDVKGANYVIYNAGGSAINLTATGLANYLSFPAASATSTQFTLGAKQTALITTTTAGTNYVIDAITGISGGSTVSAVSTAADQSLATILTNASITDAAQAVYVITNTDTASHTVALGTTILNPSAFPGYAANPNITIPAGGTATVTTASPNTSYYIINISNSVAADLSAGLINEIPYQVGPSNTGFIANVAGDANKYLMSNGVSSAPAWTIAPGTHYLAASATSTVAALLTTASITDVVTASYAIVNTGSANINITATNFVNSASFSTVATATQVTLKPNQTLVISTRTANTNYVIDTVSGLGGGGTTSLTISAAGTLASLLTAASVTDQVGNTYVVTNTAATTTALTVGTTIDNATSFPNSIATNIVTLLPKQVVTLTTTVTGANYTVENISDNKTVFSLSVSADATMAATLTAATIYDRVGNVYTINNSDTAAHTITFGAVTGYEAFGGQTTNTTVIIPAKGSITVFTKTVDSDYQLVTIANTLLKTYYIQFNTAGATWTVPQILTGAGITDAVGNNYIIYNTLTASFAMTATSFPNVASYQRLGNSVTSIPFPAGYTIGLVTKVVGSTYAISSASQTLPVISVNSSADLTVGGLVPVGKSDIIGQIYSIYNSGATVISVTTTGTYSNYSSFSPSSATVIFIQPKQTYNIVTETVGSNYRILSASTATGVYTIGTSVAGTIPSLLTLAGITDVKGNIYTINNSGSVLLTLEAGVFTGYQAYSNQATSTALSLLPGGSAVISANAVNDYQIMNISATGSASNNCFSVGATAAITIPSSTNVIAFNTINFDPLSCWNAAQSRWVPQVAGYYQVNLVVSVNNGNVDVVAGIQRNGADIASDNSGVRGGWSSCAVSTIVYMNGTTDYLQGVGRAGVTSAGAPYTQLSASLITAQPAVAASNSLARATPAIAQSIPNNAETKVNLGTATYNPRGWMDTVNNSRFQPNVAGYYQVTAIASYINAWSTGFASAFIRKNGAVVSTNTTGANNQAYMDAEVSDVIYLNGSSDYLEFYTMQASGNAQALNANGAYTYFDVALVGGLAVSTGASTAPINNTFKANTSNGGTGPTVGTAATKVILPNEIYDPLNAYDVVTGKFQPTTAGYYRMLGRLAPSTTGVAVTTYLYLNGAAVAINQSSSGAYAGSSEVSSVIYLNGTTDYVELYGDFSSIGTARTSNGGIYCEFSGELVGGVSSTPLVTGPQLFKSFTGQARDAYVGVDALQIAWKFNGTNFYVVIKTTTGSMSLKGFGRYNNSNGGYGNFQTGAGNANPIVVSTTDVNLFGWQFGSDGTSVQLVVTDVNSGYTYNFNTMLGNAGNNNYTTVQRNINNA
jgi:hypothetical protein